MVGRLKGDLGVFEGSQTYDGKPIIVRFICRVNAQGLKVAAAWEQAIWPMAEKLGRPTGKANSSVMRTVSPQHQAPGADVFMESWNL